MSASIPSAPMSRLGGHSTAVALGQIDRKYWVMVSSGV